MRHCEPGQCGLNKECRCYIACRPIVALSVAVAVSIFVSGCGVTLSPVKRAPVQISPIKLSPDSNPQAIVVEFESTLPNEPLADTLWDNIGGTFADTTGSEYIEYVQDYRKLRAAFEGVDDDENAYWRLAPSAFGDVGGAAAAIAAGTRPDYTRIVIPFGRIFEGVFRSGVLDVYPNAIIGTDADEINQAKTSAREYAVSLRVTDFEVWEHPLNHINMKASVEYRLTVTGQAGAPASVYEAQYQVTNQAIGSLITTSRGFVHNLNKVSNEFAAGLSIEILQALQKEIKN